jgi:uncharacterized membrane protein YfcA
MSAAALIPLIFLCSTLAGLLGSLTGLGGGVVIVPLLVLGFGYDLRYAIGASLIAVIATSAGAAAAYLREGYTNIRIGIILEVATTIGALSGAFLAAVTPTAVISTVFGAVLLYTAITTFLSRGETPGSRTPDPLATRLHLNGTYPVPVAGGIEQRAYFPRKVVTTFIIMLGAGVLSALIGIGSGIVKVFAMDKVMGLPFKVSTTTSNFMIGVTAAASAGVFFQRGQIEPRIAAPVALGALAGAFVGAKLLTRLNVTLLRRIFACVVLVVGIQMIVRGVGGLL